MSVVVYAGSAQFLSVGLLATHTDLVSIFITTLLLNLRHIFYGLSVLNRYQPFKWLAKIYAIFALTDETYSVVTTHLEPDAQDDAAYCFYVSLFDQIYWVIGSALGALLGASIEIKLKGLEFTLTALFVVLAVEQALKVRLWLPFFIAGAASCISLYLLPNHLLIAALSLTGISLFMISIQRQSGQP